MTVHHARWLWLSCATLGVASLVALALFVAVDGVPLARSADDLAADLRGVAGSQFGDPEVLGDLRARADVLATSASPAAARARWIASFAAALSWVPALDREAYAWAMQVDRLDGDLALASDLLGASSDLLAAYEDAEVALLDARADPAASTLPASTAELEAAFESASVRLEAAEGYRVRIPGLRLPRLSRALETLAEAEDRMRFASSVGLRGSRLLVDLLAAGESVRPLVGQFTGGATDRQPLAYDDLVSSLEELGKLADSAMEESAGLAARLEEDGQSPELLSKLEDLHEMLGALQDIGAAARTGLDVLGPVLRNGGSGFFGDGGTMIAAVDAVNGRIDEVEGAVDLLGQARDTFLRLSPTGARAAGISDFADMADSLQGGLRLLADLAPLGRELLGADGPRRYLVLGQSADELRAAGGFVSALWLVTIENGVVLDIRYHDAVRVDDWDRLELYPPAPPGLAEHMNARVWLLRDVSWEPDFPTVARTAADMYMIGQRQAVDGVVAINQWTLHGLLEAIGRVTAPGGDGEITPRNLFDRLEEGSDTFGRAYADLALQGILDKLNQPLSLGSFIKIASAAQSSLRSRDLMIYMENADAQALLKDAGWDGSMGERGTDYLYVVDSNVGWSKADRNIQRRIRYDVDLRKGPGARATLTLGYSNHSGPGSPGCEPQWLNRGTNYTQLKNACYWDFWRVYTPLGSRPLGNTPMELPVYSVSAEIGRGQAGEDTFRASSSYNRTVLSGLFALGAGEQTEFNMVYDLSPAAVQRNGGDIEYELLVQKQPGSRGSEMTLELVLPTGYRLASSSMAPTFADDSRIGFDFRVEQDTLVSAVLTSNDESR